MQPSRQKITPRIVLWGPKNGLPSSHTLFPSSGRLNRSPQRRLARGGKKFAQSKKRTINDSGHVEANAEDSICRPVSGRKEGIGLILIISTAEQGYGKQGKGYADYLFGGYRFTENDDGEDDGDYRIKCRHADNHGYLPLAGCSEIE